MRTRYQPETCLLFMSHFGVAIVVASFFRGSQYHIGKNLRNAGAIWAQYVAFTHLRLPPISADLNRDTSGCPIYELECPPLSELLITFTTLAAGWTREQVSCDNSAFEFFYLR